MLTPSTIHEVESGRGKYKGDLYSFFIMRMMRRESIEAGERAAFASRPLSIIMEQNLANASGKMLFMREGKRMNDLSDEEYLELLKRILEQ